ncbi:MAG: hypothetical protein BZ138_07930 [Methanosphaera sp. rholeuAM270]|nr:MAG: hypothetical protein BZ138_07930 [Methanosphaera sp. rholeuAM270]
MTMDSEAETDSSGSEFRESQYHENGGVEIGSTSHGTESGDEMSMKNIQRQHTYIVANEYNKDLARNSDIYAEEYRNMILNRELDYFPQELLDEVIDNFNGKYLLEVSSIGGYNVHDVGRYPQVTIHGPGSHDSCRIVDMGIAIEKANKNPNKHIQFGANVEKIIPYL